MFTFNCPIFVPAATGKLIWLSSSILKSKLLFFVLGTVKIISDEALTDDNDSFEPGTLIKSISWDFLNSSIFSYSLNAQVISLDEPWDLFCCVLKPFVTEITLRFPSTADAASP
mgnify:CR=1 FL=1